jgi:hypothetical protein
MKTLRKAFWGIFFLAPLFLPSQTKAGPYDWRTPTFGNHRQVTGNPFDRDPYDYFNRNTGFDQSPVQERFGVRHGGNDYRPFNPWDDRNSHGLSSGQGGDPGAPNSVPIDGGLIFLLVAGLGLGAWKVYGLKRSSVAVA